MSNRIFIQTDKYGQFINTEAFSASCGFQDKGYHVIPVQSLAFLPSDVTREDIAFGNVNFVLEFLDLVGIKRPQILDYPDELRELLGREVVEVTLGDLDIQEPTFIKPSRSHKLFTGMVLYSNEDVGYNFCNLPKDTPIWKSTIVDFVSEYRVFVRNGRVLDCRLYSGDWKCYVDPTVVEKAVNLYKSAPVTYSIDFGVTEGTHSKQPQTLLLEVNDAFSCGSYGLDSLTYAHWIESRWIQITN